MSITAGKNLCLTVITRESQRNPQAGGVLIRHTPYGLGAIIIRCPIVIGEFEVSQGKAKKHKKKCLAPTLMH